MGGGKEGGLTWILSFDVRSATTPVTVKTCTRKWADLEGGEETHSLMWPWLLVIVVPALLNSVFMVYFLAQTSNQHHPPICTRPVTKWEKILTNVTKTSIKKIRQNFQYLNKKCKLPETPIRAEGSAQYNNTTFRAIEKIPFRAATQLAYAWIKMLLRRKKLF